jgi:hypothetical protein
LRKIAGKSDPIGGEGSQEDYKGPGNKKLTVYDLTKEEDDKLK